MSAPLSSLFGWSNIASNAPQKVLTIDHLFNQPQQQKQTIAFCLDCSGSTTYESKKSYDNKTFAQIYSEAMLNLTEQLPKHRVICWSSVATELNGDSLTEYQNAIKSQIPVAKVVYNMNNGTDPQQILPLIKNCTSVIVTDGEISENAINLIKQQIPNSGIGSVFLVIVPHIDTYKNMYAATDNEITAKDNIKISIPQAFSERLATVIIWNYRKRIFEIIPELTAPWVDKTKNLYELLNAPVPIVIPGEFLTKYNEQYRSFSINKLVDWLKANTSDITIINKLIEFGVRHAIRQQASTQQREIWNTCIQNLFHKLLNEKIKNEYVEVAIPVDATMLERIKITTINDKELKRLDNKYRKELSDLFANLLIEKTVGELQSVGSAKATQTIANVAAFASMKQEDKLTEISSVLVKDACTICGEHTNVFKTISVPTKLLVQFNLCTVEKQVSRKKGKMETVKFLDFEQMKSSLEQYPPRLYFMNLCTGCSNISLDKARLHGDPENCITGLVPQNQVVINGINTVTERLFLCPLISSDKISDMSDPNDPKLSFARQWLRGFISKVMNLEPASNETLNASLMFLTAIANDKNSAEIVLPNQKSLISGGRNNRWPISVGRLFKPSVQKISAETLNLISIVSDVVELAEIQVIPESNRLLLLCLLGKKVNVLLTAKRQRDKVIALLDTVLNEIKETGNSKDKEKFGITNENAHSIHQHNNIESYKNENNELVTKFVATYLQNIVGVNVQMIAMHEASLINVLNATTIKDVSIGLNTNEDYLQKMIGRSNLSSTEFMTIIPKFVNEWVNTQGDKMNVMMKFL